MKGGITMKSSKEIGQSLSELRGNTPRAVVAEAIGVSNSALQMYENGERVPRDETKVALAAFYHTTVGSLFFGE
jgi:transcriptional regulator with XRE-family HTH domain